MAVLLVDADCHCQEAVRKTLREDGLTVIAACDGLSGLDAAIAEKPDLILADFHLQGIDIFTFIKKIRRRAALAKTPLILLLPKEEEQNAAPLQAEGLAGVLTKPIDAVALSRAVLQSRGPIVKEEPLLVGPALSEEFLQKSALAVIEKIAWEYLPSVLEKSLSREAVESMVARVVEQKVTELLQVDSALQGTAGNAFNGTRETILEVVEKISWEVVPGVLETALPKEAIKELIERIVWETVPQIAEIEIKKEIKRLQPEEGESL
jgi:two-component system chemotaxis response regulator CheY